MHFPRRLFLVAALTLTMPAAGCDGGVAGTAVTAAYPAPDLATAKATPDDVGKDIIAVSDDGSRGVVISNGRLCARPLTGATGAAGTSPVCASDDGAGGVTAAAFSPDGSRYVGWRDPRLSIGGGAWIVRSGAGGGTEITLPGDPSVPTSGGSGTTVANQRPDPALVYFWTSGADLFAVGVGHVYRIDPETGTGEVLVDLGDPTEQGVALAAFGGSRLVLLVERASRGGDRLVSVDLRDGTVKDPVVDFGADGGRPVLMGVSPDGARALVSTADFVRLVPGETSVVDLTSGKLAAIPGTERTFASAGGFSPDGSLIALISSDQVPQGAKPFDSGGGFRFRLAPADGSAAPREIGPVDGPTAVGPLRWTRDDTVATTSPWSHPYQAWTIVS